MNKQVLNIEIQEFININLNTDISKLALKGSTFSSISIQELIEQIEAKKKCEKKLPTWYRTKQVYYPNKLNIEQASSEITAEYKSKLITGHSIIDMTGGFGVDSFYFAKQFEKVTHCEINEELAKIVAHNYKQLKVLNIKTVNQDGVSYLKTKPISFDWIYIDPSRRHDSKGKVFYLRDCFPNVPKTLSELFTHTNNILIKTSPMLDLSVGISELNYVKTIHIVAIKNEVKEVLFHLEKGFKEAIKIKTINITPSKNECFDFNLTDEHYTTATYRNPYNYLYEPNGAVLKSGAFQLISNTLKVDKLHIHTHLYTSNDLIDFPGRRFKIIKTLLYNKKEVQKAIGNKQVNLSTRNFPESVEQLKTKFKLKDGGDTYVFFTTQNDNKKVVIICNKCI